MPIQIAVIQFTAMYLLLIASAFILFPLADVIRVVSRSAFRSGVRLVVGGLSSWKAVSCHCLQGLEILMNLK